MREAFHAACKALHLREKDNGPTDIVAEKVVELAKAGERDPKRLCALVWANCRVSAIGPGQVERRASGLTCNWSRLSRLGTFAPNGHARNLGASTRP
jgi:hypothetical protein